MIVGNGYPLPRAVTIRAYRTGIPAWYDCPISTGKVEGINHKIKVMKRVAYGFRDERYFQLRLYALHDCRITPNVGWTQNLAMPRTFHCVIYLLGSIRNHSVSQRAFASQHGEKAHGFALYGRHRVAGIKGRLCFIKRKDKRYISNNRNFKQKNIAFLRRKRTNGKNLWTFSRL